MCIYLYVDMSVYVHSVHTYSSLAHVYAASHTCVRLRICSSSNRNVCVCLSGIDL